MDSYRRGELHFDVRDSGPRDGETAVLLHGFPQPAASWSAVAQRLAGAGLRVLAPDQRGYSPGARPSGRRSYRLRALVEDVLALLDAAGLDRAHVVGHDWGGAVAWALAMWRPDRLATVTSLSTPHPSAMRSAMLGGSQLLRSWYMLAFQVPALPEYLLSTSYGRGRLADLLRRSGLSADRARQYVERLAEPGALSGGVNWYRGMPLSRLRATDQKVSVPVLYVWGPRDRYLGKRAAELTERWMAGPYTFHALAGAGHWLPEEHPDAVADMIIEHVRRHPARAAGLDQAGGEL
jgi:pimeloyl-ACP methyl ester carboxylesterase